MKQFAKVVASHLSPAVSDIIHGVGLGYDPVPCNYHETFIDSDFAAFVADAEALYLDWCCVQGLLADRAGHTTEVRHHGHERPSERQTRRRERELA